jgi:hypothetical protein
MQNTKDLGILASSENPQKLADTVKGLILGSSALIIYIAHLFGVELVTEQISQFAIVLSTSAASIWTLYGLVKKAIIAITNKFGV